jgi:hypothetical protein
MLPRPRSTVCLLLALLAPCGCTSPIAKNKQLLKPAQMSPDSVVLELFFVRFPLGDPEANDQLWQEVDEQHFPADVRKRLMQNGFRVGILGGQIPIALSQLLELADKAAPSGRPDEVPLGEVTTEPRVQRRHMPLRAGVAGQIVASGVYDQLPVLLSSPGELCGQTYYQAQGIFSVTAQSLGDGQVRLEILPEIHHDQAHQRWVGDQGMFRLDSARPKRAFDELGISATLAPGAMLVMTSLPSRPGSLGHHFFTDNKDQPQQKLLVIRLAQTQNDGAISSFEFHH